MQHKKYNKTWLINQIETAENQVKFLFFWGHRAKQAGVTDKSCFSQWWPVAFTVEGITYPSAEHWMMAKKAKLFQDEARLAKILASKSPSEAKKHGRAVQNFDLEIWKNASFDIVCEGNLHKFSQHETLKTYLLQTGNRVLVEASPVDPVWGIGMAMDHRHASEPAFWKGENLLGFALMAVRDRLRYHNGTL